MRFPLAETQAITENCRTIAFRRRNHVAVGPGRSEELKEAVISHVQRRFAQGIAVREDC